MSKQATVKRPCLHCNGFKEAKIIAVFDDDREEVYVLGDKETLKDLTTAQLNLVVGRASWSQFLCPTCSKEVVNDQ
jgi:hypothetical protein